MLILPGWRAQALARPSVQACTSHTTTHPKQHIRRLTLQTERGPQIKPPAQPEPWRPNTLLRDAKRRLQDAGIELPHEKRLQVSKRLPKNVRHPPSINVSAWSRHMLSSYVVPYIATPHPMTETIIEKAIEQSRNQPLWLNIGMRPDARGISKNVVRKRQEERMTNAFRRALVDCGYDKYGKRREPREAVSGEEDGSDGEPTGPDQLYGVVYIRGVALDLVKVPFETLVEYSTTVIEFLEPILGCAVGQERRTVPQKAPTPHSSKQRPPKPVGKVRQIMINARR